MLRVLQPYLESTFYSSDPLISETISGIPLSMARCMKNLHAAIAKVLKAANAAGKKAGIFCTSGEQSNKYAKDGFHMISVATDTLILQASIIHAVNTAKGLGPGPKLTGPYGK